FFNETYDITDSGNFEGKSIPNLLKVSLEDLDFQKLDKLRNKLFEHREKREHPYKDDKILTAWNGLMLAALSMGARILNNKEYLKKAHDAARFILENLYLDNRLYARYRDGEVKHLAYLDDYAFFIWGLIELYESSFDAYYLKKAIELNREMMDIFEDKEKGGLFLYGKDGEKLIARTKEIYDGAIPSGNSVAAFNLLRLGALTGQDEYFTRAETILKAFGGTVNRNPLGHTFFLSALMFSITPYRKAVLCGPVNSPEIQEFIAVTNEGFDPFLLSLLISPEQLEELEKCMDIEPGFLRHQKPVVYLCENFTCHAPTGDKDEYKKMLQNSR
ncbi:MAG: thioredoxin domain-containing protein, partial [Clostridia bacterium]|nr:thioredoxin domain-containing protein [Clostridia bacterium]